MQTGPWVRFVSLLLVLAGTGWAADIVRQVRFEGNRSFHARVLSAFVLTRRGHVLDEAALARDAAVLQRFYRDQGFAAATVKHGTASVPTGKRVDFRVVEGPRTRVAEVLFKENRAFSASQLRHQVSLRQGSHYTRASVVECEQSLRTFYLNSGYPFVSVEGAADVHDTSATVSFHVSEGELCRLRAVRVRGNLTVRTATVVRAAELRLGEVYSQRRLQDAQRRLYGTKLFQRVLYYVSRPDSASDGVEVRFDVVEQPYRSFDVGVGFEVPPARALLSAGWEHDNLFNLGQRLQVGGELSPSFSGDYRVSVDATWLVPYLVTSRHDFQVHPFLYWEKVDTLLQREYGIETGMSRNLLPQLQVGVLNKVRFVSDTADGITNLLALTGTYDSRDDVLDPHRGVYAQAGVEAAGGLLGGTNDFYRFSAEARLFVPVAPWLVLAARATGGQVSPFGRSPVVPHYEEFFVGGRNNLRGYRDRSLGPDTAASGQVYGPRLLNGTFEVRGPYLFGWVGLVAFVDCASITASVPGLSDFASSAGLGVRVRTPLGPVRVDWGRRLSRAPAGDVGRFYFGVLHAF